MLELIKACGSLMVPILLCSLAALAIVIERLWTLRRKAVLPPNLVGEVLAAYKAGKLNEARVGALRDGSPLGRVLAAGLANLRHPRHVMKEAIEDVGRQVVHELERFLNTLGTIAAIAPLLGLLGTVVGMIKVFSTIVEQGIGNPGQLAGGISVALITTAAGLSVAIPALMFSRYLRGRVDSLVIGMEEAALELVEVIHGDRERIVARDK